MVYIKIFFIISTLERGGAERVVINLASAFKKRGHDVSVVTFRKAEEEYAVPNDIKRFFLEKKNLHKIFF